MNNNRRRLLERRREARRVRLRVVYRVDPPPPGICPFCCVRPGTIEAEVNAAHGSERVIV